MALTATTTRTEYAAELQAAYEPTVKFGGNLAIYNHWQKVQNMTDEQFVAHRAERLAANSSPAVQAACARMAVELMAKKRRAKR